MALSVMRKGLTSLTICTGRSLVAPVSVLRPQMATIMSKNMQPKDYARPPPYPYKESDYGLFHALLDKTTYRFDENSKIIVVDGPFAAGKTKFAKEVAAELDMLYIPEANMDMHYINSYGYDLRQLDPQLPESVRSFDEKDFHRDPKHTNAAGFQFHMFRIRLEQYIGALAHLLSTGQGCVLDRSVYSDFVFAETMAHCGYLSKRALSLYYECKQMTVPELLRPHLVVYLDVPVDVCLQRVKERNLPHEANSPICTPEFFSVIESNYKQRFLKEINSHSQILVYDWSEEGDPEVVVEDIERVNFDFGKNDPKMSDWQAPDEWAWCELRMKYTKYGDKIVKWMTVPDFSVSELVVPARDMKIFNDVWFSAPGQKFAKGFNKDMGDEFILTKIRSEK